MPAGELPVICPNCNNRTTLPLAAIKRDNFYCSRCLQKIPLGSVPIGTDAARQRNIPVRTKKSSRSNRRS